MKTLLNLLALFLLSACSEATSDTEITTASSASQPEDISAVVDERDSVVTTIEKPIAPDLPSAKLIPSKVDVKSLTDTLEESAHGDVIARVLKNDDLDVVLEIDHGKKNHYILNLEDSNIHDLSIELDWKNLTNLKGNHQELLIWYTSMDATNGFEEGFEEMHDGLLVVDIINRHMPLAFEYVKSYASYAASEETLKTDEHGKKSGGAIWDSCVYQSELKILPHGLELKNALLVKSKGSECDIQMFENGEYNYNETKKVFEAIKLTPTRD